MMIEIYLVYNHNYILHLLLSFLLQTQNNQFQNLIKRKLDFHLEFFLRHQQSHKFHLHQVYNSDWLYNHQKYNRL